MDRVGVVGRGLDLPLPMTPSRQPLAPAKHRAMPEAVASFGAAVQGEYLYVFSGHAGTTHKYGRDKLSDHFRRLRFDDPAADWEELPTQEPAQSAALVSDASSSTASVD